MKIITLRVEEEVWHQVSFLAAQEERSGSAWIRLQIKKALENQPKPTKKKKRTRK